MFTALLAVGFSIGYAPAQVNVPQVPADFLTWHGWNYLKGAPAVEPSPYDIPGLGKAASNTANAKASQWRLKVVIFTRTESDDRDPNGVLREFRKTIESTQLSQIQAAIAGFSNWVQGTYDTHVAIAPDIEVEAEWMRDSLRSPDGAFGAQFAKKYLEGRFNGGLYEAEDKVFRGPFNSVIYILPGAGVRQVRFTEVNDTPVAGIYSEGIEPNGDPVQFETLLKRAWLAQVQKRVKEQGYKDAVNTVGAAGGDPWPIAASLEEPTPQDYVARLNKTLELQPVPWQSADSKSSMAGGSEALLATDVDRGQVLRVTEASSYRLGGVALPARADGMALANLDATPTLSFGVMSTNDDPISIRIESTDGKRGWISIGTDPPLVSTMPDLPIAYLPVSPNGKWQNVSIDLRQAFKGTGITNIVRMEIEPSPSARLAGKQRADPINYEFDGFSFTSDPGQPLATSPAPDPNSDDEEARALFAAQAKASSPQLATLLKDKSELVRLNATAAYQAIKDPTVRDSLISNSLDLDPSVAAAAMRALMYDGSDAAVAVVKRSVRVSLSDYAKMEAAQALAETKDPKMADDVLAMFNNRSWTARLCGVESLAMIPGNSSDIMRLAFLRGDDPEIKLAVTRNTDPNNPEDISKLLWSAINEPSDMVRLESDVKLIESNSASNRTEGFKGVRDDSTFVRVMLLRYIAAHPTEDARNALRLAVTDKSARVRATALTAFASMPQGASSDEIANVLDDANPVVQLALIDLSKRKGLKLPKKTLDSMAASGDPEVVGAAKGVGNAQN